MSDFYRVALPGLAGREKRDLFNGMARWVAASVGLSGAIVGLCWLGPFGAILGLCGGLMAGAKLVVGGRFYRR